MRHSLKYLAYLAEKRKESEREGRKGLDGVTDGDGGDGDDDDDDDGDDVGGNGEGAIGHTEDKVKVEKAKRQRVGVPPTVSELMQTAIDVVRW